jgi:tyrosyl-tRNA synthetase
MPALKLSDESFTDGYIGITDLLVLTGLCPSKSDARRNIDQGGVEAAGERVADISVKYTKEALSGNGIIIKRGKKKFYRVYY